jgi:hypothetical protein
MSQSFKGILVNIDINSVVYPFLNQVAQQELITEADLYPFIDQYADTQVTDIALNVFCQYSNTPSAIITDAYHKYEQKMENGHSVDYTATFPGIYKLWHDKQLDVYAIWFRRSRELGLKSWLSVRMNDAHEPDEETSFLRSAFSYTARARGWVIGAAYGYYRFCLDYAQPVVRHLMLAYIAEQLDRYDVDGLELDWLREIYCFDYLHRPESVDIMNDFMRQVKVLIRHAENRWGHKISLMARLMRDIEQNKAFGFDVRTWVKEDLVDVIAVGPRWNSCDSAMPVQDWKALCGSKIPVFACLEILVKRASHLAFATTEVARGYATHYLHSGADKIYLYNYFQNPYKQADERNNIYRTCGDLTTLQLLPRRHIVTWQDLCPAGYLPYKPLPCQVETAHSVRLDLQTGPIRPDQSVKLIFGLGKNDNAAGAVPSVNGNACSGMMKATIQSFDGAQDILGDNGYNDADTQLYACNVQAVLLPDSQQIEIKNTGSQPLTLTYIELDIRDRST